MWPAGGFWCVSELLILCEFVLSAHAAQLVGSGVPLNCEFFVDRCCQLMQASWWEQVCLSTAKFVWIDAISTYGPAGRIWCASVLLILCGYMLSAHAAQLVGYGVHLIC